MSTQTDRRGRLRALLRLDEEQEEASPVQQPPSRRNRFRASVGLEPGGASPPAGLLERAVGAVGEWLSRLQPEPVEPTKTLEETRAEIEQAPRRIEGMTAGAPRQVRPEPEPQLAEQLQAELAERGARILPPEPTPPDLLAATRRAVEQPMRADVVAEPPKPAPEQRPYAEQGLVGEAVAGLGRGVGQGVEAAGGMGEVLARVLGAPYEPPEQVTGALRSVAEAGERIQERPELARSEAASDAFNPRSLRWWVAGISEVAPQMLAQLGAAALTGGGSAAIAAFGAPAFALEGGLAYRQALENGASPEQATGISLVTGAGSAALESIPGSVILLNKFPGARQVFQRSLLARLGARGAAAATAEGSTEAAQEAWADAVAAASKTDPDAFEDWRQRYPAAAAIGAAVGAGATVGTRGGAPAEPAVVAPEELTPEQRAATEAQPPSPAVPGATLPEARAIPAAPPRGGTTSPPAVPEVTEADEFVAHPRDESIDIARLPRAFSEEGGLPDLPVRLRATNDHAVARFRTVTRQPEATAADVVEYARDVLADPDVIAPAGTSDRVLAFKRGEGGRKQKGQGAVVELEERNGYWSIVAAHPFRNDYLRAAESIAYWTREGGTLRALDRDATNLGQAESFLTPSEKPVTGRPTPQGAEGLTGPQRARETVAVPPTEVNPLDVVSPEARRGSERVRRQRAIEEESRLEGLWQRLTRAPERDVAQVAAEVDPADATRLLERLRAAPGSNPAMEAALERRATTAPALEPPQPDPIMRRVVDRAVENMAADADAIEVDTESLPDAARLDPPPDPLDPDPEAALQKVGDRIAGYLTAREGSKPGRGVSAPEVIRSIAAIARAAGKPIPIRVGRLGRYARRARGLFFPQTMVIRINQANNIATAAHELGHGLERILFGWPDGSPWQEPLVSRRVQNELTALGKSLYGDTKPAGGYMREGWAEYVRIWITRTDLNSRPADPARVAPELTQWFEESFSQQFPEVRRAFDSARTAARSWAEQGSLERARQSMVDTASPRERTRRAIETTRGVLTVAKWIEQAQPFKKLTQAAEQERGRPLAPEKDPYQLITALRTTHAARARYMVEHAVLDLAGNIVGPSLAEIRPLVRGREQEFAFYLWAKRTLALGPDRPSGLSLEDAAAIVEELETPKFETAGGKVYAWNDGVLDYAAQASPSFRRIVERVRERDPGNYVPLQRVFDELDRNYMTLPGGAGATRTSPVRRLKGSGRRIKSILPTMIANAEQTVRAAHRRAVMEATVKLANVEGMGHLINEIPPDRVPAYTASLGRMLNEIETALGAAGIRVRLEDAQGADPNALLLAELMGETVTFFTEAQRAPNGSYIYPVWGDNRVRWFELDAELFDALSTLDVYRMHWLPELFLGRPASLLRAGTTGLRASFGLIWNPLRDIQAFWVNTRSNKIGGRLFAEWARGMAEMAVAQSTGKRSALADAYQRLGLEMTQSLGQDIPQTRLAARRLFQGRVVRTVDPRNLFEFYRDLVQFPEAAPRVAEMRLLAKRIGWEPDQPMNLS